VSQSPSVAESPPIGFPDKSPRVEFPDSGSPERPTLGSVAIVHDYLNQPGGAERVVLALAGMWPDAPIYTSLYRVDSTFPGFGATEVRTSPLDFLPVDRGFRNLFPLYPVAFRSLGTLNHDLVISSSSGWAHSVHTAPQTFHAVYCHAPPRWLYGGEYLGGARERVLRQFVGAMRTWDRGAASRADLYIANSNEVRRRIRSSYGIDAPVVHPPVDLARFRPSDRGERLLVVSRLLPYKRIDAIVDTATRAGIGLDVVGMGPSLEELRRRAGPTVTFHGRLDDEQVLALMQNCRALVMPGREDFGITPVEANAAGKPVIALGAGGALETIEEGVSGAFFTRHEPEDILAAIDRCDRIALAPEKIAQTAQRFSRREFELRLTSVLEEGLAEHRAGVRVPERRAADSAPRTLMLGKGWFPSELGGLDRYYRDLLEHLPEASGVVIGSDAPVPPRVQAVSGHDQALAQRVLAFWRAAQRVANDADVVDAHFALYALTPLWLGRLRRKPVVLHFQGPWAQENVASGDRSRVRRAARALLERMAYSRADEAVVLSSAFRQVLVQRYGVKPWKVNVEPPGVDLRRFAPGDAGRARRSLGVEPDAFVAVSVRRLEPRMGLEVLIQAWSEAVDQLPAGSTLLIAGDGQLRDKLSSAVARSGLGDSVRILGRVSDETLVDLYRGADVAVVPTLEHEGFGLVIIEAAGCGTPSIVTAAGGLPEAVGGLDPSLIVAAGDADALRDRLVRAQLDRPSRAATRAYAERFDWSTVAERHRAIARRVAGHARADDRLRVVYLDHVARLSGGEIALLRLLPHLDRVRPHVILAEDGPLVARLHLAGISTEVLPLGAPARQLRKDEVPRRGASPRVATATAAYIVRLAAHLRRLAPDLVHTNSLKAGVYGSVAARLAGIPVVWHVRDRIAADYLPRPAVTLIQRMSRHLATAVVANSRTTMDTLNAPKEPLVIYSVLPEVLSEVPPRPRANGGPLRFGVVGRLAPWKGQDFFLRAFATAFPDGDERAVIVGAALFGEDEFAHALADLARRLGVAERAELRGHRLDVWDELSRMDVLVHASVTPEPFGQVILEGMAAGVPVVAADAGGPAEILQHETTGLLYEPMNVPALAHAMQRMRDPVLRRRLSAAARDELGPYSPPVVAEQLQQLYDEVAAQHSRRR
jgi:glycosyltransferase involved in cell wall biosynthesis